jgi:hypothetical protein
MSKDQITTIKMQLVQLDVVNTPTPIAVVD